MIEGLNPGNWCGGGGDACMGIGTKGVHVSELKYKTCPARWIYFCVGVFAGFMYIGVDVESACNRSMPGS